MVGEVDGAKVVGEVDGASVASEGAWEGANVVGSGVGSGVVGAWEGDNVVGARVVGAEVMITFPVMRRLSKRQYSKAESALRVNRICRLLLSAALTPSASLNVLVDGHSVFPLQETGR